MSNRVFITGISGFLASHIALLLLKRGAEVTGSVRSPNKIDHIREVLQSHGADTSKLSFTTLDLLKDEGWEESIAGHDYLIHTASPFVTTMPKDPQVLVKPAVEGVERAIEAGLKAGVKRIVLTSSMAAVIFGHGSKNISVSEDDWTNPEGKDVSAYVLSKTLAERKAWQLVEAAGKKELLAVINPGFIMGPVLEKDIGTSGALLLKMLSGGFPGAPNVSFSCIDVRDAAELHLLAMENEKLAGERCLATGPSIFLADLAKGLAEDFPKYARKLPTRKLPDLVVRIVGLFDGDAKTAVQLLGQVHDCESTKAEEALGRELISTREAAKQMAQTIIEQGLV